MDSTSIATALAEAGLVASDDKPEIVRVARPSRAGGITFPRHNDPVIGEIGGALVETSAPVGEILKEGDSWRFRLASVYVPGPGPVFFDETFSNLNSLVEAVKGCYFGDTIDFSSDDLRRFVEKPELDLQRDQDPDLEICGLRIWVLGRSSPASHDYWDGNWLNVRALYEAGRSRVETEGTFVRVDDFAQFVAQVDDLYRTLHGEALLKPLEPNVTVRLVGDGRGHLDVTTEITPDHLLERHEFSDAIDQTYLPTLASAGRRLLERFPIRDPRA